MNVVEHTGIVAQVIDAIEASNKIKHIELTEAEMREFLKYRHLKHAQGVDLTGEITNISPAKMIEGEPRDLPSSFRFRNVTIKLGRGE